MINNALSGVVVVALAIGLRVASPETAFYGYLVLSLHAFRGRVEAVQALALCWLITMPNSGLAGDAGASMAGRYAVFAAAAASVFARSRIATSSMRLSRPVVWTLLLGTFLAVHSALFSPLPEVSILKALSWTLVTAALLGAWHGMSDVERNRLLSQIVGGLVVLLTVSAPLLLSPLGFLRNGKGFQGVLNHPQTFGVAMALLAAWLAAGLLSAPRPSWNRVVALAASMIAIVLSESRTAGLALLVGVAGGVACVAVASRGTMRKLVPGLFTRRSHLWALSVAAGLLLAGPALIGPLGDYFQKRSESSSAMDLYDASRGRLVRAMWANIEERPVWGSGFGIASDPSAMQIVIVSTLGLPMGASVEKGVMPIAVLEEVGVIGALAVLAWLLALLTRAVRGGIGPTVVIVTAVATNLGEATLFSPGGVGLLVLAAVSWAGTSRAL